MLKDLIMKNRSYRRFYEDHVIDYDLLRNLVDLARHCASGKNMQTLKYILSCDKERNSLIFPCLRWAGYLKDWGGPEIGERPSAYIIILHDTKISNKHYCDEGIAAQSILLGAVELGLGGCMIAAIERGNLTQKLSIQPHLEILLVLALGKPKETVVIDKVGSNGDIKYWRDNNNIHHVPKRSLDDIIISL